MPDEPETYDLAFDPDEEPEASPPPPPTPSAHPSSRRPKDETADTGDGGHSQAGGDADDDGGTIPLDLPEEPEIRDPRAGNTASRPPSGTAGPGGAVASTARRPSKLDAARDEPEPASEEPAAVSPAKARAAREEQRIRAAQEQAEADARKQKLIFIAVGSVVGLLVLLWLLSKIF